MWDEWLKANNVICSTGVQYQHHCFGLHVDTFVREELNSTKKESRLSNLYSFLQIALCQIVMPPGRR